MHPSSYTAYGWTYELTCRPYSSLAASWNDCRYKEELSNEISSRRAEISGDLHLKSVPHVPMTFVNGPEEEVLQASA